VALLAAASVVTAGCTRERAETQPSTKKVSMSQSVIPAPVSVTPGDGTEFALTAETRIATPTGSPEAARIGEQLAAVLRRSTGFALPITEAAPGEGAIALTLSPGDEQFGPEGYELVATSGAVMVRAAEPEGLFRGGATLRQLLPPTIESPTVQTGAWRLETTRIVDRPRFGWRGAMLDVSRHFFSVEDVKRYIDAISLYKLNRLHLHLSDDQGWRMEIASWPELARHGGRTAVGGGRGGFYTQQDYTDIVAYARERYITVVPEIDMPGHTNAALASYAELNCDGKARDLYTGVEVGFSSLCVDDETTYRFIDDIVRELAGLTPGPYLHIGGDEVKTLSAGDYTQFIERVQAIVTKHGKTLVGWEEVTQAQLLPASIAQYWNTKGDHEKSLRAAAERGTKLILSPAGRAYLDMKYDDETPLGLEWAGHVDVKQSYDWEPGNVLGDIPADSILGVEAPTWTETLQTIDDVEFMAFPRLPGIAEIGWSPPAARDWAGYRQRLAQHAARWQAMGLNYHRASGVPWPTDR
jgi:hexosaminidase